MGCGVVVSLSGTPLLHPRGAGGASRGYLEVHMSRESARSGDGVSFLPDGVTFLAVELVQASSLAVSALKEPMLFCSVLRTQDSPFSLLQIREGGLDVFGPDHI